MNVRDFLDSLEAARQQFLPCLDQQADRDVRQDLNAELQHLEASHIVEGLDPRMARKASCSRVKVLHGLGYPVDFDWLHGPACAARAA